MLERYLAAIRWQAISFHRKHEKDEFNIKTAKSARKRTIRIANDKI